jgi:predicted outer membrane protein/sporulation protein YlmC with PRC-barrel domain
MNRKTLAILALASTALMPLSADAQNQRATSPTQTPSQQAQNQSGPISATDFVTKAAIGNMFEVESSKVALEKTQNEKIRPFARRMVQDHTAAGDKLKAAAQSNVPTQLDQQHTQMLNELRGLSGQNFERRYVQMQVSGHRDAVSLFDRYTQQGDNQQLKQFAQQTLPTLRDHLKSIEEIQKSTFPNDQTAQNTQQSQPTTAQQSGQAGIRTVGPAGAVTVQFYSVQPADIRASDLMDMTVYNLQNETIGEIEDLILDDGKNVRAVVLSVGGFLGIGDRHVTVVPASIVVTKGSDGSTRAVINSTKDDLKNAPAFNWERAKTTDAKSSSGSKPAGSK